MKMNKVLGLVMVMVVVGAVTVFAAGVGERPDTVEQGRRFTEETTGVTVTGTIEYRGDYPVLIVGNKAYSLSARQGGLYSDDLVDGMELTVTGERIEALDSSRSDADYHIFVSEARANGETIEFDADQMGRGAGQGRISGRGNTDDDLRGRGAGQRSGTDQQGSRRGGSGSRGSADTRGAGRRS